MKTVLVKTLGLYLNLLALIVPDRAGRKGFLLFCRPFRIPFTDKQRDFLNSAEKFTIMFNDQAIQGYKWGRGKKKILLLHGWESHSYRWKAYVEAFSKEEYTLYSIDAPGHGLSQGNFLSVPLYSSLIEHLVNELGEIHTAVAHSVGGFSLLYTLYRYPALAINKLVLLAPPGRASDFMDFYRKTLSLSDRTTRYIVSHFQKTFSVPVEYFSAKKFASAVKREGLIIHDEEDDEAPYHYATEIHAVWNTSQLVTTKGLGHNLRSTKVVTNVIEYVEATAPSFDHVLK